MKIPIPTGSSVGISLIYSLDNKNWLDWDCSTGTTLKTGQKLYLKSTINTGCFSTKQDTYTFNFSQKVKVYGNIMSLVYNNYYDKKEIKSDFCFSSLFDDCISLIDASNLKLPATTLTEWCYDFMFKGCESLISAPQLPATSLSYACYNGMFCECTNLTSAPDLPATTLATWCYSNMFEDCTSLTFAPKLPATTLAERCYSFMFSGCTSLMSVIDLPATTLAEQCYNFIFIRCLKIPELHYPASIENDSIFKSIYDTPWFGASNATVYYDL